MNEFSVHFQLTSTEITQLSTLIWWTCWYSALSFALINRSSSLFILNCKIGICWGFPCSLNKYCHSKRNDFPSLRFFIFPFFCVECLAFNHHILYLLFSIPKDKQCTSLFSIFFCSFTIRTKIFHSLQNAKKMLSDTLSQIQISLKHWRQRDKTNLWQVSWYKSALLLPMIHENRKNERTRFRTVEFYSGRYNLKLKFYTTPSILNRNGIRV